MNKNACILRGCLGLALAAFGLPALAVPQCSVATGAQLNFGAVVALASTPDQTTDSGGTFWINCNSEVASAPQLFSSSPRFMSAGSQQLAFSLSLVFAGGGDLPAGPPGTALGFVRNGTNQNVTLYGKIRSADFKSLPGGVYSTSIILTIEY